ncbi:EspA/EspE family type VII secretion system effector [Mycolicibacterium wolinskyi]|uniref:EspA/EspE family type VII secretion system effector n=1 Tax=Mycolicibacterium wolinskyi TaxID=59750 RepID=UPI0039176D43
MSLLDAFMQTWSQARGTFGHGNPVNRDSLNTSDRLRQVGSSLVDAKSNDKWQGSAADSYDSVNAAQTSAVAEFANLDRRFAAEIDRSATAVIRGRQSLDEIRDWVVDAAVALPKNEAGQRMLIPIVKEGISGIAQIVRRTHTDQSTIAARLRTLAGEYAALEPADTDGNRPETVQRLTDDETQPDTESHESKVARWQLDG